MDVANRVMVEAWNTVLYEKFCRFRHLIVEGVSQHSSAAFDRCRYPIGSRVLDVGCGFGAGTLSIANRVGPTGEAVGLDCAENFVRAAEAAARKERVENARFVVGDAQTGNLFGPYDHAFASFGTMFFLTPEDAMVNVRKALKPGATFTQIVWRRREENPWLFDAEQRVKEIVPVVSHDETDQVHCGPGPFSLADADTVSTMLRSAGFERISFERHDCDICIGRDLDDAVDFAICSVLRARSSAWRARRVPSAGLRSLLLLGTYSRPTCDQAAFGRRQVRGSSRRRIQPDRVQGRVAGAAMG